MPTTNSGIYEVVLEQTYGAELVKNVFHYLHTLGNDDEQQECADAFDEDALPGIASIANDLIKYTEIRVANLTGLLADASIVPSIPDGDVSGLVMPSFISCPFRYIRTSKETRNGAKRFGGITEENITGNNFIGTFFTAMQAIESVLAGQIDVVGAIFEPIILRKPDVAGVYTYNEVANVIAVDRVTTQNSRKTV